MMHHQTYSEQESGRDREGEKEMGGLVEARQSDLYKELLRKEVMNGWKNTDKDRSEKSCSC